MAWELLAMWAITSVAVIWFLRDERRLRADATLARAARYYAFAPQYRHVTVEPPSAPEVPLRRTGGLSPQQRAFLQTLVVTKAPTAGPTAS